MSEVILDVACGSRMFWFDKKNPNVTFCDNRREEHILCDGRNLIINPDVLCDFTELPFEDNTYKLVIFDPPHLINVGKTSYMSKKYGKLENDWESIISNGFSECFRVLDVDGVLIFKWSECQIKVNDILKLTEQKPLFGHKSGRLNNTHWICFMKHRTGSKEGEMTNAFDKVSNDKWGILNKADDRKSYDELKAENNTLKNNIGEYTAIMLENAELKAENERLKQDNKEFKALNKALIGTIAELNAKVAELQEALRKCSPFTMFDIFNEDDERYCYSCQLSHTKHYRDGKKHKDDCSYVRLCGGVG